MDVCVGMCVGSGNAKKKKGKEKDPFTEVYRLHACMCHLLKWWIGFLSGVKSLVTKLSECNIVKT